jgi:hypothetical protein
MEPAMTLPIATSIPIASTITTSLSDKQGSWLIQIPET